MRKELEYMFLISHSGNMRQLSESLHCIHGFEAEPASFARIASMWSWSSSSQHKCVRDAGTLCLGGSHARFWVSLILPYDRLLTEEFMVSSGKHEQHVPLVLIIWAELCTYCTHCLFPDCLLQWHSKFIHPSRQIINNKDCLYVTYITYSSTNVCKGPVTWNSLLTKVTTVTS